MRELTGNYGNGLVSFGFPVPEWASAWSQSGGPATVEGPFVVTYAHGDLIMEGKGFPAAKVVWHPGSQMVVPRGATLKATPTDGGVAGISGFYAP